MCVAPSNKDGCAIERRVRSAVTGRRATGGLGSFELRPHFFAPLWGCYRDCRDGGICAPATLAASRAAAGPIVDRPLFFFQKI